MPSAAPGRDTPRTRRMMRTTYGAKAVIHTACNTRNHTSSRCTNLEICFSLRDLEDQHWFALIKKKRDLGVLSSEYPEMNKMISNLKDLTESKFKDYQKLVAVRGALGRSTSDGIQ